MNNILIQSNNALKELQLDADYIDLLNFLQRWDKDYLVEVNKVDLFKAEKIKQWSSDQKKFFIRVFYHLRGHFSDLLWHMGSFAPTKSAKALIISNIADEFNEHGLSHEQLYHFFASAFDVDLTHELLDNHYYLPFARDYIEGQLRWLRQHSWEEKLAMFAAIERLDNVDYTTFRDVAVHMGTDNKYLTFFNVHINADHFENVLLTELIPAWKKDPKVIRDTFYFVLEFQINMFVKFSKEIEGVEKR